MERESLIKLLQRMLESDLPTTRRIVESALDDLSDPAVDDLLTSIIATATDDRLREAVVWHADLIRACRDIGIDAAISAVQARQTAQILATSALEMAKTPRWDEMRATADAYPEILTELFDRQLCLMIENIQAHRDFIKRYRTFGSLATNRHYGGKRGTSVGKS